MQKQRCVGRFRAVHGGRSSPDCSLNDTTKSSKQTMSIAGRIRRLDRLRNRLESLLRSFGRISQHERIEMEEH